MSSGEASHVGPQGDAEEPAALGMAGFVLAAELMRPLRERHFISIKDGELIIERALSDLWCRLTRLNNTGGRCGRRSNSSSTSGQRTCRGTDRGRCAGAME